MKIMKTHAQSSIGNTLCFQNIVYESKLFCIITSDNSFVIICQILYDVVHLTDVFNIKI